MARANNLTLYNSAYPVYKSIHLFENHDPFFFLKDKKKLSPDKKKSIVYYYKRKSLMVKYPSFYIFFLIIFNYIPIRLCFFYKQLFV